MISNAPSRVDEIQRGPVIVPEGPPDRVVAVDHDRVPDAHLLHRTTDVVHVPFEWELGRVDADHDEPFLVPLRPGAKVWQRAEPVDARIGPEIDEHDFAG